MTAQAMMEQSSYRAGFEKSLAAAQGTEPSWLSRLRESAFERFEQAGFPTTDDEDWKYTSVSAIARKSFQRAQLNGDSAALSGDNLRQFVNEEAAKSRLVFVNGFYRPELSDLSALPAEALATDLATALQGEHGTSIRSKFSGWDGQGEDAFTNLNTAFFGSGAFLFIPKDVKVEAPIQLLFLTTDADVVSYPRVLIVAGRGSRATVIESYAAIVDETYLTDSVAEVFLEDNSRVTHYRIQTEGEQAFHISSTRADLGRDAGYDLTTVTLGAKLSRHNAVVRMDREGAECWVDGLYLVGEGQHADTHSLIDHRRPHCVSHQNYKGILDGKSRAVFNGRVFVHRDAQQTDAMQSNKNLLLSPDARVDTKPQLEIYADDVKCAHGATVGQLEEEELFYLVSRGLHPELARNLLTYGFAEEIVEKIGIESIRAQLDEAILNRLHARLEV
jgi:Fe-S cluster assembly protein SufD